MPTFIASQCFKTKIVRLEHRAVLCFVANCDGSRFSIRVKGLEITKTLCKIDLRISRTAKSGTDSRR